MNSTSQTGMSAGSIRSTTSDLDEDPIEDGGGGGGYGGGGYGGGYYGGGGGYYGGGGGYYGGGGYSGGGDYGAGYGGSYGYGYGGEYESGYYSASDPPTSASASGKTVTYTNPDGTTFTKTGDHPDRDNNPLDLKSGTTSSNHGAIGDDKGFAIFPDAQHGFDAAVDRLGQIGGTLNHIISVWSPASDGNNTAAMQASIPAAAGLSGTDTWSSLSAAQQQAFVQAYAAREGYHGN